MGVLASNAAGCVMAWTDAGNVGFSPDGRYVAFSKEDSLFVGYGAFGLASFGWVAETHYVGWARVDKPRRTRSARLAGYLRSYSGGLADVVECIRFSPDSRHIAVLTMRGGVFVIDPQTGKCRRLKTPCGTHFGLSWLDGDDLGYGVLTRDGESSTHLRIYRHSVSRGPDARAEIYHQEGEYVWPLLEWSPDGRYAILARRVGSERPQLLEIVRRKVSAFDLPVRPKSRLISVCWKPDSSAAMGIAVPVRGEDAARQWHMLLIEPRPGGAPHVFAGLDRDYSYVSTPSDEYSCKWTADGRYAVVNYSDDSALVSTKPWRVTCLKGRATDKITLRGGWYCPVYPLVPGWLWTTDKGSYSPTRTYAVDYQLHRAIPLNTQEDEWACSPDGTRIAEVNDKGKVAIRELNLPVLMTTTQPATTRPVTTGQGK